MVQSSDSQLGPAHAWAVQKNIEFDEFNFQVGCATLLHRGSTRLFFDKLIRAMRIYTTQSTDSDTETL